MKLVEVEVLVDVMRDEDGIARSHGDLISIPEDRAEKLERLGAVGKKGDSEKAAEEVSEVEERAVHEQRLLAGLETVEPPVKRGPGRPRKTAEA